ncbi:hypothetical protein TheetDRAFT_2116 [Thermoanaerobacter ethanolicus JW 200]|jgi:hypothetical protein|nr:hypothetical protein TheetDRAFT_2116 [Thermoanaerobacter ethanolicus JW 200]MDI3501402.1 hypothetical protein [Thermoanaerobacter sp.]
MISNKYLGFATSKIMNYIKFPKKRKNNKTGLLIKLNRRVKGEIL